MSRPPGAVVVTIAGSPLAHLHAERPHARGPARPVPVTLAGVLAGFGVSREYAQHLVQPDCRCGFDGEGRWVMCGPARDQGQLRPNREAR